MGLVRKVTKRDLEALLKIGFGGSQSRVKNDPQFEALVIVLLDGRRRIKKLERVIRNFATNPDNWEAP